MACFFKLIAAACVLYNWHGVRTVGMEVGGHSPFEEGVGGLVAHLAFLAVAHWPRVQGVFAILITHTDVWNQSFLKEPASSSSKLSGPSDPFLGGFLGKEHIPKLENGGIGFRFSGWRRRKANPPIPPPKEGLPSEDKMNSPLF